MVIAECFEGEALSLGFVSEKLEATTGFEPVMGVLQTPALPLGYVARRTRLTSIRPDFPGRTLFVHKLVRRRRLELLRLAARPPQDRVSADSTTSAGSGGCARRTSISAAQNLGQNQPAHLRKPASKQLLNWTYDGGGVSRR